MRTFRFLVIFSLLFFMFAACSTDEEIGDESGNNSGDNTGDDNSGDNNGDENQQNLNCGNKITDDGEVCDGNAQECTAIDSGYTGGFATCKTDCSGWDVTGCQGTPVNGGDNGGNGDGGNGGNGDGGNGGNGDGGNGGNGDGTSSEGGTWVDPKTYLMWENPMGNTGMGGTGISHANAVTYCDNLVLAGHDDWRLPTIDELRTLVRGVSTTMTGGKCPTSESCTDQDSCNKDKDNSKGFGNSCLGCVALDTSTYDPAISYLDFDNDCQLSQTQLNEGEYYIVKAMFGDPYRLWSSTKNTSIVATLTQAYYYLNYVNGQINSGSDTMSTTHWVRCVRQGTAADVTEEEEEAGDPSQNWECTEDTDCTGGKTCQKHKCVSETYTASNGLEWQRGKIIETINKWEDGVERIEGLEAAKEHCENLEYAGHDDWRLPNIDELKTLVQGCAKTSECAVSVATPGYNAGYLTTKDSCDGCGSGNYMPAELGQHIEYNYWSSTEDPTASKHVWSIDFKTAAVYNDFKTANLYAMCVRGSMN